MDIKAMALEKHEQWQGKIEVISRAPLNDKSDLSLAYTPGVAEPCLEIQKDPAKSYVYTRRHNLVAVITDGTAVLGLGDIGPEAAMPVMEGKCALFKAFADVDAFPLCVDSKDVDEFVKTVTLISKSFGAINLEDIAAPRCFEIERRLKESCDIPIFHDDQHGTAVVAAAAVINALRVAGKKPEESTIVVNGAGAAGIAVIRLLLKLGFADIIACDIHGAIYEGAEGLTDAQREISLLTNKNRLQGTLADAMRGADVFFGVSRPNLVSKEMVASMAEKAVVFAMANPVPEIMPQDALDAGAYIAGTGRSDFPNQINNVLAFPGIFKGALAVRASDINEEMKLAAAYAIAGMIEEKDLAPENIIPNVFTPKVADVIAAAVAEAAIKSGVARI